jgi:hypothetical protein
MRKIDEYKVCKSVVHFVLRRVLCSGTVEHNMRIYGVQTFKKPRVSQLLFELCITNGYGAYQPKSVKLRVTTPSTLSKFEKNPGCRCNVFGQVHVPPTQIENDWVKVIIRGVHNGQL